MANFKGLKNNGIYSKFELKMLRILIIIDSDMLI